MNTLKQNLESIKFYGKNAYIRVILFRIILLLITLLPIWYFKKHKKEFEKDNPNQAYKFVHKYTGASTSSFVLVMAPIIFINSPHIGLFLDEKRTEESTDKTSLASIVIILRLFIIAAGFVLGMLIAGIPINNLNLFVGALGVGIGFGMQSFFANLISGIIIAFEKPLYVADIVELEDGTRGRVTDIGIRSTTVDTADGAEYTIPNNEMIGKVLKNWTLSSKLYKLQIELNVDYNNDPETVQKIALSTAQGIKDIMPKPAPTVQFLNIRSNGLQFEISCWVKSIAEAKKVKSQLLTSLHKELMAAGVKYPKPTQDKD